MKTHSVSFVLITCLLGLMAVPLLGQDDTFWINPAGGEFGHATNWDNGVPGVQDSAIFELNAVYEVEVVSDETIGSLSQSDGNLTLSGGNRLSLSPTSVASIEGIMNLREQDTELNGGSLVIGNNTGNGSFHARTNTIADFLSLAVGGSSGSGSMTIESGASVNSIAGFVGANSDMSGTSSAVVTDPGSVWTSQNLYLGTEQSLVNLGVANVSLNNGGKMIVGDNAIARNTPRGGLFVSDSGTDGSLFIRNGSQLDTRGSGLVNGVMLDHQNIIGVGSFDKAMVSVSGTGSRVQTQALTIASHGTGSLIIEDGGSVSSTRTIVGNSGAGTLMVSGNGSSFTVVNEDEFFIGGGTGGTGIVNIENGGLLSTNNTQIRRSSANVSGTNSLWNNSGDLWLQQVSGGTGGLNVIDSGVVSVGGSTLIAVNRSAQLDAGRFEFGTTDLTSYGRIFGTSGELAGTIRISGYSDINSLSDYSIANLDTTEVRSGNSGVIYGSGFSSHGVSNSSDGEIRTLGGEWARFDGRGNTNAGEINNFIGTIEFTGDLTNEAGGFVGGRGQFISGGGTTNHGVMAFSGGNADVLGDVMNLSGGQIVTSGFGVTTFFDDVEHNGAEIRTADGSASVFLGGVTGAGSFTGAGDVFFEGDLRPGNSPDIVSFEGDVFLGGGAFTSIELAGLAIGEFDMLDIEGDLSLDGSLDVSLLDGFTLGFDQEFLIADVGGLLTGQFDFLGEGDLVGNFAGRDLFISYTRGNGNDIGLFTTSVPEPGTATFMGFALISLMIRRRRQKTPVKVAKISQRSVGDAE